MNNKIEMTDKDEQLLTGFFKKHKAPIEDNGFSQRVMHNLPQSSNRVAQIWTTVCATVTLVLFIAIDGVTLTLNALREALLQAYAHGTETLDPLSILAIIGVLLFWGYQKGVQYKA